VAETAAVIAKLGANPENNSGVFTPSTTTSILCVLNWLKSQARHRIVVACPAYFSLFHAARRFGIATRPVYLRRSATGFQLGPAVGRLGKTPGVLWLTNPVYGAGVYLENDDIALVNQLLTKGWTVIADECLALSGRELVRQLGHHPNFVGIYSPHKGVCMNGVKFSAVVFHTQHQAFMERWADVWYGGLGASNSLALAHFLSANFDGYATAFTTMIGRLRTLFDTTCRQELVEVDPRAAGHFVSCYFPNVPARLGSSASFLRRVVYETGGSLITGNRSRFHPTCGLSFRVNLARGGPRFAATLHRLIRHVQAGAR
jgi:aspartate/methionine/tyrosine aminotransferase